MNKKIILIMLALLCHSLVYSDEPINLPNKEFDESNIQDRAAYLRRLTKEEVNALDLDRLNDDEIDSLENLDPVKKSQYQAGKEKFLTEIINNQLRSYDLFDEHVAKMTRKEKVNIIADKLSTKEGREELRRRTNRIISRETDKKRYYLADENVMKMSLDEKKRYYLAKVDKMLSENYKDQEKRFYLLDFEPEFSIEERVNQFKKLNKLLREVLSFMRENHVSAYGVFRYSDDIRSIWPKFYPKDFATHIMNKEDYNWAHNLFELPNVSLAGDNLGLVYSISTYLKGGNEYHLYTGDYFNYDMYSNSEGKNPKPHKTNQILYTKDKKIINISKIGLNVDSYNEKGKPLPGYRDYNLSDFEYIESDTPEFRLKRQIEKRYETIYLYLKAIGMIRKTPNAFYPKSFLREYADQTGLTQFIQVAETKAGKQLKHDQLAEIFFGSYDDWMTGFEKFLHNKLTTL